MANLVFYVVVGVLYFIALRRPGVACGYTLAGFVLEQSAESMVPVAGNNPALCNYLLAGSVLVGLARRLTRDGLSSVPIRPPAILVLALLGYCYASALWSIFPTVTTSTLNGMVPYLVVFVALAPLLVEREEDLEDCLSALIFSTAGALVFLLLFATWESRGIVLPYQGAVSNPLVITQSAGALLIAAFFSPTLKRFRQPFQGLALAAVLFIVTITFLRTASRGQIMAAVSTTLLFSTTRRGGAWIPLAILGVAGMLASGFLSDEVARNASRWNPELVGQDISKARVGKAEHLIAFWSHSSLSHIFFGLGHATARDPRLLGGYPHVVPAEVLGEEGLIGALIYATTLLTAGYTYVRAFFSSSGHSTALIRPAMALTVYEFLLTLKQGTLLGAPSFLLLIVLAGAMTALSRKAAEGPAVGPAGALP